MNRFSPGNRPRALLRQRDPQRGQMVVLFALTLVAILAMAGLLVDGGMAWTNRRAAQAAADTAVLASAQSASKGENSTLFIAAATSIATANGFPTAYNDCGGVAQTDGVVVNRPPISGPHAADTNFIEVTTKRPMRTAFAGTVGQACWMVSARAVASVKTQVALCNFCALSDWLSYYTLDLDNGNDLRVDGEIMVNQDTWYAGTEAVNRCGGANPCSAASCGNWNGLPSDQRILMCGTSLYVDHSGGVTNTTLSAATISVNGGWQVRNHNDIVHADGLAASCPAHPQYTGYTLPTADPETNVCIGVAKIADPLNDPAFPLNIMPVPDTNALSTCPGATYPCGPVASASCYALPGTTLKLPLGTFPSPAKLSISGTQGSFTICPGLYFGGFGTNGDAGSQPHVIMLPGIYFMVGGGFTVTGTASIDGSSGVMIYNSGGPESFSANTVSDPTLIPTVCPPAAFPLSTCLTPGASTNLSTGNGVQVGNPATYTFSVYKATGQAKPTGGASAFTFYDGQNLLPCTPTIGGTASILSATCTATYYQFGTRGITAIYSGDSVYKPVGDTGTQAVNPPSSSDAGNINIDTKTTPCAGGVPPCGVVVLHAQTSGRYSGLLIFQDRLDGIGIKVSPAAGLAACTGNWMTDGVPPNTQPVPAPCGALGGLSGTIYAHHQSLGASDWDTIVNIEASGVTNMQVIASQIHVVILNVQARFAFDANSFANGKIHLVE